MGHGQLDRRIEDRGIGRSPRTGPAGGPDGHLRLRHPDEWQEGHRVLGRRHARHRLHVYQSTTTATGTYTLQTTVTTTTWTSAALATGSYWYEVVTDIGTNWASAKSPATAQRTISSSACS